MSDDRRSDTHRRSADNPFQRPADELSPFLDETLNDQEGSSGRTRRRRTQRHQAGDADTYGTSSSDYDSGMAGGDFNVDPEETQPSSSRRAGRSGRASRTQDAPKQEYHDYGFFDDEDDDLDTLDDLDEAPKRGKKQRPVREPKKAAPKKKKSRNDEDVYEEFDNGFVRDPYDDDPYDDEYDDDYYDDDGYEGRRSRKGLWIALGVIIVIALAVAALVIFFPTQRDMALGKLNELVANLSGAQQREEELLAEMSILSFIVDNDKAYVGDTVIFSVVTSASVQVVQLRDNQGETLAEAPNGTDGATVYSDGENLYWALPVTFNAPYAGIVDAYAGSGDAWASTAFSTLQISVTEEPEATPVVTATLEPTATPAPTPSPTPTPEPTPSPTPTPVPYIAQAASPVEAALPVALSLTGKIIEGDALVESVSRSEEISMGDPEAYAAQSGVLTFRGGPMRANAAYGNVTVEEQQLSVVWEVRTDILDKSYTGIGWTGQPLIVKWHKEIRELMNIKDEKKEITALKEVIFAAMDGQIYFLDLDDGTKTRESIRVGYPMKGTPAVDPRGYPILYAGQGISKLSTGTGTIGMRIFNLLDQEMLHLETGRNTLAPIVNGAVDGSPLVEAGTDTLIYGGENGLLYTIKLNTSFNYRDGELSIDPQTIAYTYEVPKKGDVSMESSVAIYGDYVYTADGNGTLQCVDMNTMTPVWVADVTDNTDATVALEIEADGSVALYTGCTVLKQGNKGSAYIRKFNALTGEMLWEQAISCKLNKDAPGGAVASPVIGEGNINDLVIFTLSRTENSGDIYAFDKSNGDIIWQEPIDATTWSSPIAVYVNDGEDGANGTSYLIQGDDNGVLRLLDGYEGITLDTIQLDGAIQGSPAAYDDMIVVGTTDSLMYGIRIK